jgi:hypothetical protein
MVKMIERHVVKKNDGWAIEKPDAKRPSVILDTQQQAIARAREIVEKAGGGAVVIHKRDGTVRSKDIVHTAEALAAKAAAAAEKATPVAPAKKPSRIAARARAAAERAAEKAAAKAATAKN